MKCVEQLGIQIQNLISLNKLYLHINLNDINYDNNILKTNLFKNFSLLKNLQELTLNFPKCSTAEINHILENIKNLTQLNLLNIFFDYLIDNAKEIYQFKSEEFPNLNYLEISLITSNNYGKSFYKSLDNLRNLRVV